MPFHCQACTSITVGMAHAWSDCHSRCQPAEPDIAQHRVDDADDRIEHQDPDDPRRHRRHDHRQEDDRPVDVRHPRAAVEHHRQPQRDGVLKNEDEQEELPGVQRRPPEAAALQQLGEIGQPDRVADGAVAEPAEETEVEGADRRVDEEDAIAEQRRQDEPEIGHAGREARRLAICVASEYVSFRAGEETRFLRERTRPAAEMLSRHDT